MLVSAKTGKGVDDLLEQLVHLIPEPKGSEERPLKALIFDSQYDPYRGVIVHIRLFDGSVKSGDQIRLWWNDSSYTVEETGIFRVGREKSETLTAGQVGYLIAGIKNITDVRVGDTITNDEKPCAEPLKGFKEIKPVVFSSIYPLDTNDYEELHADIDRLKLNDASLVYEKDSSAALGFGFRCGFLGLLHLEVVQERLEREFDLSIVFTAPSVRFRVYLTTGEMKEIDNPADWPDSTYIEHTEEPYIKANIITPTDFLGNLMNLCMEKRGVQIGMNYLDEKRVELIYDMPLSEVLFDFYDKLKSVSRGYASFDYEVGDYKPSDLVKLDILVNGEVVDALAQLVHREKSASRARAVCKKLKDEIPKQQFKIPLQGAIGNTIIARETISALRKDVTAKCYGGDITRKRKLLERQKQGRERLKMVGSVELPQSAFVSVLKSEQE